MKDFLTYRRADTGEGGQGGGSAALCLSINNLDLPPQVTMTTISLHNFAIRNRIRELLRLSLVIGRSPFSLIINKDMA